MKSSLVFYKVIPLVMILLLSFSSNSIAGEKLTLGIKGNIGFSKNTETVFGNSGALQSNIGGQVNYFLLPFLGIESGVQFNRSGFSYDIALRDVNGQSLGNASITYKYDYVIVPAYLRMKIGSYYGTAGVNFAFNTGSNATTTSTAFPDGYLTELMAQQDINKTNYDLHLGIGYQKMFLDRLGFFLEIGYNIQLSELHATEGNVKPKLWNLNFGGGLCVSLIND